MVYMSKRRITQLGIAYNRNIGKKRITDTYASGPNKGKLATWTPIDPKKSQRANLIRSTKRLKNRQNTQSSSVPATPPTTLNRFYSQGTSIHKETTRKLPFKGTMRLWWSIQYEVRTKRGSFIETLQTYGDSSISDRPINQLSHDDLKALEQETLSNVRAKIFKQKQISTGAVVDEKRISNRKYIYILPSKTAKAVSIK